jgi:hypothetical protein
MADVFTQVVIKLVGLGFANLLIFIIAMALIYALLKQRKVFGDSTIINGLIAFSVAFLIFAFPAIIGVNLISNIVTFFYQSFVFMLIFFIGFLIAGFFYPNIQDALKSFFQTRNTLYIMIALSLVLFVISGLATELFNIRASSRPSPPQEITLLISGLIIAIIILLISSYIAGSIGGKK